MPTYEYKCDACGHKFEKFQSITSAAIKKCPKCGKLRVKRLIGTGAGVIFKGGGFYTTDYRSEAYKTAAKSDAPPSPPSESKSDSKTDSKTESPKPDAAKSETPSPKSDQTKPAAPKSEASSSAAKRKSSKSAKK